MILGVSSDDVLVLRTFLLTASTCGIAYNLLQPKPLIAPALWGTVFISAHIYQISNILKERLIKVEMSQTEEVFYSKAFLDYGFTPRCFKEFVSECSPVWQTYKKGDVIAQQGLSMQRALYLTSGKVKIVRNDDCINKLSADDKVGHWIGEVWSRNKDLEKSRWPISVIAAEDTTIVSLDMRGFRNVIMRDPRRMASADRLQIEDLWGKLRKTTSLIREKNLQNNKLIASMQDNVVEQIKKSYVCMVNIAAADGEITPPEMELLNKFRQQHGIEDSFHEEIISELLTQSPLILRGDITRSES